MAKSKTTLEPINSRISNNNLIAGRLDHKDLVPVHIGFGNGISANSQFSSTEQGSNVSLLKKTSALWSKRRQSFSLFLDGTEEPFTMPLMLMRISLILSSMTSALIILAINSALSLV